MSMKLTEFQFDLPEELIAQEPADYRDESRMMVVHRASGEIEHKKFKDIHHYFNKGDVFVVNNTKVFPARLFANKERNGSDIEVFLLRELNHDLRLWDVLVDPARKIRVGNKLFFTFPNSLEDVLVAEVIDNTTSRGRTLKFLGDDSDEEFLHKLMMLGDTPLPKYIQRSARPNDKESYQTIFAKTSGAVAAPAAGLHFSREIFKWFELKEIKVAEVTLHLGLGAYRKIEVEDLSKHKLDSENYIIPAEAAKVINEAKAEKANVVAVGNTVLRAVESAAANNRVKSLEGWTEKWIYPPFEFSIPTAMVTGFHAPKSAFFISTAAFAGVDLLLKAYDIAIKEKYRFLDYGDAMLII